MHFSRKRWLQLLSVWLLLLVIIIAAATFVGGLLQALTLDPIRAAQMQRITRLADGLERNLSIPVEELLSLSRTQIVRDAALKLDAVHLDRASDIFIMLANSGLRFDQIRLLDATGMERLRVNHRRGQTMRSAENVLQDKSNRYYFVQSRTLDEGQVFISRIDLNMENNVIEVPHHPTLRIATPIRRPDGSLSAVLVINLAVEEVTPTFRRTTTPENPVWFIDHQGYWLKGPRPELEWGFQLKRPDARIHQYDPSIANALESSDHAQVHTNAGLWTLSKVTLNAYIPKNVGKPGEMNQFGGLVIAAFVPQSTMAAALASSRWITIGVASVVWLVLAAGAAMLLNAFEARERQAQEAETARQRLRMALLGGGLSMWIIDFDKTSLYLNASWERITGYPQGPSELKAWFGLMHRKDAALIRQRLEEMRAGQVQSIEQVVRLRHHDGQWLTLALYGGVVAQGEDGHCIQVAGVLRDISDLASSEERLRLALQGGELCWWDWHLPSDSIAFDERFSILTGLPSTPDTRHVASEILGTRVHPDDLPEVQAALQAHFSGRASCYATESRLRRADGAWAWVASRGEVVERGDDGNPVRIVGTFHDITARKQLAIELAAERDSLELRVAERTQNLELARTEAERANTAKNTFLTNISHEMRTPMHGIIGFADMGEKQSRSVPPEILESYFSAIRQSAVRLLGLINDLLDISKLDSGMMSFNPEHIDPVALIESYTDELQSLMRQKNLRFAIDMQGNPPSIVADPIRIGQVVRNLLANAIRYSPEGGVINITAGAASTGEFDPGSAAEALRIVVSDQGCGIPPEEINSIFDKFVQSSRTQSGAGGSGLGLSICRDIVTQHGGCIRARNNTDAGASFEVILPVNKDYA